MESGGFDAVGAAEGMQQRPGRRQMDMTPALRQSHGQCRRVRADRRCGQVFQHETGPVFGQMTGARRLPGGATYFFRDVRSAAEKGRFFQKLQTLFVDQDFPIGRIKPVLVLSHRRCEHAGSGRGRFGQTIIDFKGNGFIGDHTGIGI